MSSKLTGAALALGVISLSPTAWAQDNGDAEPMGGGEPPAIEAPKAPSHGMAIADGGGRGAEHVAWTVGSGPGNDIGMFESLSESRNSATATIGGNTVTVTGRSNTILQDATIDVLTSFGQSSVSQNAGQNSAADAGTAVNFVVNQGEENAQSNLEGAILQNFSVDEQSRPNGSERLQATLEQTAAPDLQSAVNDGTASAAGGGRDTVHNAHTVGSGTGNDVGFDNSTLASTNDVLANVTSNAVAYTATRGNNNLSQVAELTNVDSTGQFSLAQNAGNNSSVSAGTSVAFIANFTTQPSLSMQ